MHLSLNLNPFCKMNPLEFCILFIALSPKKRVRLNSLFYFLCGRTGANPYREANRSKEFSHCSCRASAFFGFAGQNNDFQKSLRKITRAAPCSLFVGTVSSPVQNNAHKMWYAIFLYFIPMLKINTISSSVSVYLHLRSDIVI